MTIWLQLLFGNTLTRVVFFPTLACLPLLLLPAARVRLIKLYALGVALVEVGFTVALLAGQFSAGSFLPLRELGADGARIPWIARYGIWYDLGIDGISMPLVALTVLLLPLVVLGSWRGIERQWRGFTVSLLLLTTGVLGALAALDLFLFYVFWELMLIPMYLLIGIWGSERRIYAAVKFFLFTMAGSLLMLLAILWMAWEYRQGTGVWSFGYFDLLELDLASGPQLWLFGAFALAFAIKVPLFPLHTWLPDAHVEAPTGGSVILAGILLKLGTYGFLRFALPFFPEASYRARPLLIAVAVAGILYGALVAWAQTDMKKLVAYSSVAHLGFVMLGLMAFDLVAWQGALLQMVNHGLSTGALFLLVGMLYDRRHTKRFEDFGGLARVMPVYSFFLVFAALASAGLPALNGFVGEFMILVGSWRANLLVPTVLAAAGVVLAAIYLLKMLSETIWGPITHEENRKLRDLDFREIAALAPLCLLMLWIGVAPRLFLTPSATALEQTLTTFQREAGVTLEPAPPPEPEQAAPEATEDALPAEPPSAPVEAAAPGEAP